MTKKYAHSRGSRVGRYLVGATMAGVGARVARKIYEYAKKPSAKGRVTKPKSGTKGRTRTGISYTKTETKTKDRTQETSQHSDESCRTLYLSNKGKTIRDKTTGKIKYDHTYSQVLKGQEGRQLVFPCHSLLHASAFINSTLVRNDGNLLGAPLFSMNPNAYVTGGPVTAPGTNPIDQFLNIETVIQDMTVWNCSGGGMEVFVMYCMPVKDCNISPQAWWDQCINEERIGVPTASDAATGATASAVFGSLANKDSYGTYPSQSPAFAKMWAVKKVHKVILQSGSSRKIKLHYRVNRKVSRSVIKQLNTVSPYMRGLTVVPMIIARGNICIQTTVGNEITWAMPELGYIIHEHYVMSTPRAPPSAPINYSFVGTVAGAPSAPSGERNINDLDAFVQIPYVF